MDMAKFPNQFQFVHEGQTYDAVLLEGDDSLPAAGFCYLCQQSLWPGRHYYVTFPFLFHFHADCAAEEALAGAGHDDRELHHGGKGIGNQQPYYDYPPPPPPYISCPPPMQNYHPYSNDTAHQYSRPYGSCYPPPPYCWPPPPPQTNYSYPYHSNPPPPQTYYSYPYSYPPPPSPHQYGNYPALAPQTHQTKPSIVGIIKKIAIAACLKSFAVAMFF